MKKVLLFTALSLALYSCSNKCPNEPAKKQWRLVITDNYTIVSTTIECDSLQMISRKEAVVYVDGKKILIFGDDLRPSYH